MRINKLLVANRGEIALRIMQASKALGVKTVGIYSDADTDSLHARIADQSCYIGPSIPNKSYLNIDAIMTALETTGADAVHPGYGFLAENADFANAVCARGITWVGPPVAVMQQIESKCYCRQIAESVGVPCTPGTTKPVETVAEIEACFDQFGDELLLKLDRGGGGKGIETITRHEPIEEVLEKAKRMGQFAFNSPDCYVEKRLDRPRHIEVQFLADSHGNCITLGERECSIQRRFQKIIEEAPAPNITNAEREQISEWTKRLVNALGYRNAGTVEFLRSREGEFFFMEINARLQVEHAVSESVTGIDIVQNQLHIAAGATLRIQQADIKITGHAIEARVYAEHPDTFVPSPGTISRLMLPPSEGWLRVDHALGEGVKITPFYDPLLAKVIAHGSDRNEAIERLKLALTQFQIEGVHSTIAVNQRILNNPAFLAGDLNIRFMDDMIDTN